MEVRRAEPQASGFTREVVIFLDRLIYGLGRRWLLVINTIAGAFSGLPMAAPLLMAAGYPGPANAIYFSYQVVCHQMPSRSFFLTGFQMAYCQRNFAIYTSIFLTGLVYAALRNRIKVPNLPLWGYVLLITPMAIDGFTQLFGWRLSTPELRVITGTLFGVASVWLAYPYLEVGFVDIRRDVERQLTKTGLVPPELN